MIATTAPPFGGAHRALPRPVELLLSSYIIIIIAIIIIIIMIIMMIIIIIIPGPSPRPPARLPTRPGGGVIEIGGGVY